MDFVTENTEPYETRNSEPEWQRSKWTLTGFKVLRSAWVASVLVWWKVQAWFLVMYKIPPYFHDFWFSKIPGISNYRLLLNMIKWKIPFRNLLFFTTSLRGVDLLLSAAIIPILVVSQRSNLEPRQVSTSGVLNPSDSDTTLAWKSSSTFQFQTGANSTPWKLHHFFLQTWKSLSSAPE